MNSTLVKVQTESFDQNEVYHWLSEHHSVGATTIFVGKVREMNLGDDVSGLYLEHYPAMTEKALHEIVEEAGDEFVLVGVSSAQRGNAYAANEFIMDYLKTKAPFWKRETTNHGERWIEGRESDQQAAGKWL